MNYMVKTLDKRLEERCDYSFEMLAKLVLMAVGAKSENVLAVSSGYMTIRRTCALGFRDRQGRQRLPSQATVYRFFWRLEKVLRCWNEP